MKYTDMADIADSSTPARLKADKLIVKPFLYGMIFGVGYYMATILLKSPVLGDFLDVGRELSVNVKKWMMIYEETFSITKEKFSKK